MIAVTSRLFRDNSNSKGHIMNEKKFSNPCLFLKAKGNIKSNQEVLGLCQRSLRPHDVIDFLRRWPFISQGSGIIIFYCYQIPLNQLHKRQKYCDMRGRHIFFSIC